MMGFDGTSVTDQVKILIEKYHVGSILLKAQNLKCAVSSSLVLVLAVFVRLTDFRSVTNSR
jgi:beta-N-acetylhexosaminidase